VVYCIVNYVAVNVDDDDDAFGSRVVMQERGEVLGRLLECVGRLRVINFYTLSI
jgi:hypothetical protein